VSPGTWSWNPEALVGVGLAAAYLAGLRRFPAARWRVACFVAGCALLVLVFATPWDTVAVEYLLVMHLLQNVVLAEWAPLLLVLGIPPALAADIGSRRSARILTHPIVALPLWVGGYAVWHVPALYDTALEEGGALLALEHLTYLVTGVLLWWCVWQDAPHRLASGARAGYVFAAFVLSAPLGLVLALVPEPIYDAYADAPERLWGLSRLADQQLGGMTMAAEQSIVFFVVGGIWFLRFLAEEEAGPAEGRPVPPDGPV
jgi:putative copper resistance protein D